MSILSIINLVSAILIWQDSKFGLVSSLICGRCDVSSGNVKFAWKNLLKRNAFRMGVWAYEVSKYTFSGIFLLLVLARNKLQKLLGLIEISWELSFMKLLYLLFTRFFNLFLNTLYLDHASGVSHLKAFLWAVSFLLLIWITSPSIHGGEFIFLFYKME